MSSRFTLSKPASRDLDEIFEYILEDSGPGRAIHVLERLHETFKKLAEVPVLGHRREDLTSAPVLFFSVWSYLVIYNPRSSPIEIVRVLHAARDAKAILGDE